MPTFNGRRLIASSIQSLTAQDYSRLEILVVDDGSTDDTAQWVAQIASQDERIRLIRAHNRSIAASRNQALHLARGSLISFLDHDDLCPPGKINRQVNFMIKRPAIAALFGKTVMFYSSEIVAAENVMNDRAPTQTMCISAGMFRRDMFNEIDPFDPKFKIADDFDFILRAIEAGLDIAVEGEIATLHRRHSGQVTSNIEQTRREMLMALAQSVRRRRARNQLTPLSHPLLTSGA